MTVMINILERLRNENYARREWQWSQIHVPHRYQLGQRSRYHFSLYGIKMLLGWIPHEEADGGVLKCGILRERQGSFQGRPSLPRVGVRHVEIFRFTKVENDEQSLQCWELCIREKVVEERERVHNRSALVGTQMQLEGMKTSERQGLTGTYDDEGIA